MAIQQKTVEIGGESYLLTQFPATKGVRLGKTIAKLAGPVFSKLYAEDGGLMPAIETLLVNLDEVDFESLAKDLVSSATKGNMSVNFDMEFAGRYDVLIQLMIEVITFNFSSVFTLLGSQSL